jgi:hypothetical protein
MHVNNLNDGVVHLHNHQTGERLNLKPGLNKLSEAEFKSHNRMFNKIKGLELVEELHDLPVKKEPEAPKAEEPKKAKKSKKSEELAEKLEPINE